MASDDAPNVEEVIDMELKPTEDRQWIVLYDEDYDDLMLDGEDRVALLVDQEQAGEIFRLASIAIASLAPDDAPDESPAQAMIDHLEEIIEDDGGDDNA